MNTQAVPAAADQGPLLVVRFKRGLVGETRRTCHLVPVATDGPVPIVLIALCGQEFRPGQAEVLEVSSGMPCTDCVIRAATTSVKELTT